MDILNILFTILCWFIILYFIPVDYFLLGHRKYKFKKILKRSKYLILIPPILLIMWGCSVIINYIKICKNHGVKYTIITIIDTIIIIIGMFIVAQLLMNIHIGLGIIGIAIILFVSGRLNKLSNTFKNKSK